MESWIQAIASIWQHSRWWCRWPHKSNNSFIAPLVTVKHISLFITVQDNSLISSVWIPLLSCHVLSCLWLYSKAYVLEGINKKMYNIKLNKKTHFLNYISDFLSPCNFFYMFHAWCFIDCKYPQIYNKNCDFSGMKILEIKIKFELVKLVTLSERT